MMKKIIIASLLMAMAFPVLATTTTTTTTTTTGTTAPTKKYQISSTCLAPAVDVRETAIMNAFTAFSDAEKAALGVRKTELAAAWKNTDVKKRNMAVNAALTKYRAAHKKARQTYNAALKAAEKTFAAAAKLCKVPYVPAEVSTVQ